MGWLLSGYEEWISRMHTQPSGKYQFPMEKVKMVKKVSRIGVATYQFPMGKVKWMFPPVKDIEKKYQFPMGKVK